MRARYVVWPLLALVLLAGAWTAWTLAQTKSDLQAAASAAGDLQDALQAGDQARAEDRLAALREDAASAHGRTDGPTFAVLGLLPSVGDDADGVAEVSRVLDGLATDALEPLVSAARGLDAGSFTPRDGRVPLQRVAALQDPLAAAAAAFGDARDDLDALDSSGYVAPLRTPVDDLRRRVERGARVLSSADTAAQVLPGMLGADGPREFLLVFQNNAEARATGGIPGAFAVVRAEDGRIELGRQASTADFAYTEQPVVPITEPEQELFDGEKLGQFIQDANFTPDFPRTAEIAAAWWQRRFDAQVDGVLSVDPVAMSYVLAATGPVEVGGRTISGDNALSELLDRPYRELGPREQDAFFSAVAAKVFDQVASGAGNPRLVLEALARGADERRLLVRSFDEDEQAALDGTAVTGALSDGSAADPHVGVYVNDGTGSKLSYYLDYDVRADAEWCDADGVQQTAVRLDLTYDTPEGIEDFPDYVTGGGAFYSEIPVGSESLGLILYAPAGGQIGRFVLDGEEVQPNLPVEHDGRPAVPFNVLMDPDSTHTLTWTVRSGPDQRGDGRLEVTPGAQPGTESGRIRSACG